MRGVELMVGVFFVVNGMLRWSAGFVLGELRVRLDCDGGDSDDVSFDYAEIAFVFDLKVQAMVVAEVLHDAVEVSPVDGDLVLSQREGEDLVAEFFAPLPAIEPREREALGRAVELGEDQGAVAVVRLAAPWIR
jgi:hypothetical protein